MPVNRTSTLTSIALRWVIAWVITQLRATWDNIVMVYRRMVFGLAVACAMLDSAIIVAFHLGAFGFLSMIAVVPSINAIKSNASPWIAICLWAAAGGSMFSLACFVRHIKFAWANAQRKYAPIKTGGILAFIKQQTQLPDRHQAHTVTPLQ